MSLRPHSLEVEGFMTFHERQEIDLTTSPILLIAGKNGVGKSSLLNAITFALFGLAFGKERGYDSVIHDRADKARVVFTFWVDDALYRVTRVVQRRKMGVQSDGLVEVHDGRGWVPIPHTRKINEMEDWIRRRLKILPASLLSSVMLMQNGWHALLAGSPAEQRRIFNNITGGDFYEFLASYVTKEANRAEGRVKYLNTKLEEMEPVPEGVLQQAREAVAEAEARLVEAERAREAAVLQLEAARERERYAKEVARLEDEVGRATALAARVDELREARDAAQVASDQCMAVGAWVKMSAAFDQTVAEEKDVSTRLRELRARYETLRNEVCQLREEEERAKATLREREAAVQEARRAHELAESRLRTVEERARIVADCERIRREIDELGRALADWDRVAVLVAQRNDLVELRRCVDALETALHERDAARLDVSSEQAALATIDDRIRKADEELRQAEQALSAANERVVAAETVVVAARGAEQNLLATIEARRTALNGDVCPSCARPIDVHLRQELREEEERLQKELDLARGRIEQAMSALDGARRGREDAERAVRDLLARREALRHEANMIMSRIEALKERERARHQAAVQAWHAALGRAAVLQIDVGNPQTAEAKIRLVEELEARSAEIATVEPVYQEMTRKRALRDRLAEDLGRLERDLARLPAVDLSLEEARNEAKRAKSVLDEAENAVRTAYEQAETKSREAQERERVLGEVFAEGQALRGRLDALVEKRKQQGEMRESLWEQAVSAGWPADRIPSQDDVDRLKEAASLLPELRRQHDAAERARRELDDLRSRLQVVRGELERVASAPDVETARRRDEETRVALEEAKRLVRERRDAMKELEARDARRRALVAELEAIDKDAARLKALVQPLGRSGLQARLLHRELARILEAANDVLDRLSEGWLQLELHIGEETDEFQILVRDALAPDRPKEFAYISGGMKFRVAVALAIGIGQYLSTRSGTHRIEMLVIDEGFGALDEEALDAMLEELERIAHDVGTVVVVSHAEKVKEVLRDGYLVVRDRHTARVLPLGSPEALRAEAAETEESEFEEIGVG